MVIQFNKVQISLLGLLIFLCGSYLGNTEKVISFIIFFLLSFQYSRFKRGNTYAKFQLVFFFLLCLSYLWAHKALMNTTIAAIEITTVLEVTYTAVYMYNIMESEQDAESIMKVILASLTFLVVYLLLNTPASTWGTFTLGSNLGINKNEIGMELAWGSLLCFYFLKRRPRWGVVYVVLLAVFTVLCLLAGSRKGLLILVGGLFLYMVLSERNYKLFRNVLIGVALIISAYYLVMNVPILYELLGERTQTAITSVFTNEVVSATEDKSIWERTYYREYAMSMFSEKPFLGYGLEGFRTRMAEIGYSHVAYSHCNYTELLADFGIVGFLVYYIYKFFLLIRLFFTRNKTQLATLFMIILAVGLVMEYYMVSYYSSFIQICFILTYCIYCKLETNKTKVNINSEEQL